MLDFIFNGFTNISYKVTDDKLLFKQLTGGKINYSSQTILLSEIQVVPNGFLEEEGHRNIVPSIEWLEKTPFLFPNIVKNTSDIINFDIFSAIFFMLSRYEEYNNPAKDLFGRFPAKESLAYKNNFLHLPVVDVWLKDFLQLLSLKNPAIVFPEKKMQVNFTYDIDVAFAYKGRGFLRQLGAIGKDMVKLKFGRLTERFKVLSNLKKDPFDNYEYIMKSAISPMFFFLLHQKKSHQDRNIHPANILLKHIIKSVQQKFPIGIHPSFQSSDQPNLLQSERETLQQISGMPITKSRQHYLRFGWPKTYQQLVQNGILEEYSMGFAERPGFRAGTCTPFLFFNLEKNEAAKMKIFPLCIMESIFRDSMVMPVKNALFHFIQYYEAVKNVQGHFICIWHNDTLQYNKNKDDPKNFRWLHEQMVEYIHKNEL